jgi:tRNA threonylcarbamoyladenosine biosynthesis protein TsaB
MLEYPVLAIDTCGAAGTVALLDLEKDRSAVTCREQVELGGRAASAELMPAVQNMLGRAGLKTAGLRSILVVNGPGSFTGVRVGLSTAKGLAHAAGVPILAISRLAVLGSLEREKQDFVALLDAGRNEYYARRGQREWLASCAEIAELADEGVALVLAEAAVGERFAHWKPTLVGPLDACAAGGAAIARLRAGEADDLATLDANYLRRSDAELFARTP